MFKDDKNLMQACDEVEHNITRMRRALQERIEEFDRETTNFGREFRSSPFDRWNG